ncbi:MAG: helix-turn-helix domain-containing protein [Piscinibacter sp.]|nr:helix-turn-helix domain-containing protein [Piscinibacter sp.]
MSRTHASTGRIYFWQGGSLWIGQGRGRTDWHAHHAHQLVLAPEGTFRFRTERDGAWQHFEGALVPSHRTHQFDVDALAMAHLFLEPESRVGRALLQRFGAGTVARLPAADSRAAARALFDTFRAAPAREPMVAAASAALARLCGAAAEPASMPDRRLTAALAYIRSNIREPLALGDVAAAVALSPSRFRHLFVAETGSSFRAYLLWLRINLAIEHVQAGATWTDAAHAAGFADSAHLTRTHRRVFGIEPSAIRPSTTG